MAPTFSLNFQSGRGYINTVPTKGFSGVGAESSGISAKTITPTKAREVPLPRSLLVCYGCLENMVKGVGVGALHDGANN